MSSDEDVIDSSIANSKAYTTFAKRFLNRDVGTSKIIKHPKNCSTITNKSVDVEAIDDVDDNESVDLPNNNVEASLNESNVANVCYVCNKPLKDHPHDVILSDVESSPNQSVNEDDDGEVVEATRYPNLLDVASDDDDLSEHKRFGGLAVIKKSETDIVQDSEIYVLSSDDDDIISISSTEEMISTALRTGIKQSPVKDFTKQQMPQTNQSIKVNGEVEKIKVVSGIIGIDDNASLTNIKILNVDEINRQVADVQPRSIGKKAMSTFNAEKDKVVDALQRIYGSLKNRPEESNLAENPAGLKIPLRAHQRSALNWLMWREKQTPSGGILADDMGFGKTLSMISLVLKSKELKDNLMNSDDETEDESGIYKIPGHTLVLCPAPLIDQWHSEATTKTSRGLLSVEVFRGPKRETDPERLASFDMVITTLATMFKEYSVNRSIFKIKWRRIIIDEAHQIRNTKADIPIAAFKLSAQSRWALTDTPVQNKEHDMFALLKFLRCKPFDEEHIWKRWMANRGPSGQERLQAVTSSLILRRTKVELTSRGEMGILPECTLKVIPIKLNREELQVYNKILVFSKSLFTEFLHRNAEKRLQNTEYFNHDTIREKILQLYKGNKINHADILILVLRLRQMCCHPSLIIRTIKNLDGCLQDKPESFNKLNLLDQLTKLNLKDEQKHHKLENKEGTSVSSEELDLFNPKRPFYSEKTISSKIKTMLQILKEQILVNDDKAIIVSQWSSFLEIIDYHLKKEGIRAHRLDGSVPIQNRGEIVANFNEANHSVKVLLLSLTAGDVSFNLIGANHLIFLDLYWNPQLEKLAQDRIYRVDQKKPVFIYKVFAENTIEKRILELQQKKLGIAESMLTGARQKQLGIQDLKMLLEM